jgi:predicted transcriptional regulator
MALKDEILKKLKSRDMTAVDLVKELNVKHRADVYHLLNGMLKEGIVVKRGSTGKKNAMVFGLKETEPSKPEVRRPGIIVDVLNRIADKTSTLSINFEDISVHIGEQKYGAAGRIKVDFNTLR